MTYKNIPHTYLLTPITSINVFIIRNTLPENMIGMYHLDIYQLLKCRFPSRLDRNLYGHELMIKEII